MASTKGKEVVVVEDAGLQFKLTDDDAATSPFLKDGATRGHAPDNANQR